MGEVEGESMQLTHQNVPKGWPAETAGTKVRLRDNPGRQGTTTGRTKMAGSFLMVEVDFGPNERQFKRYELLELVGEQVELFELLRAGTFGGPSDLRRVLTFEKIKGELTNVFYSMEASNTDFYAHQFKPVMRFIESPLGRHADSRRGRPRKDNRSDLHLERNPSPAIRAAPAHRLPCHAPGKMA